MNTTDIDTMTIDQLKADFWSIMSDVVTQYGDNLDGREQNEVSVQGLSSNRRVETHDYEQREVHLL